MAAVAAVYYRKCVRRVVQPSEGGPVFRLARRRRRDDQVAVQVNGTAHALVPAVHVY